MVTKSMPLSATNPALYYITLQMRRNIVATTYEDEQGDREKGESGRKNTKVAEDSYRKNEEKYKGRELGDDKRSE